MNPDPTLPPALNGEAVIATVIWLAGSEVPQGDPRFGDSGNEAFLRILAGDDRNFALWPDGSLTLASPDARAGDAAALLETYRRARAVLETLAPGVRLGIANATARHWPAQPSSTFH